MPGPVSSGDDGGEYAILYRPDFRAMPRATPIERYAPYNYQDHPLRVAPGQEPQSQRSAPTVIHEPEDEGQEGRRSRKRIAVACLRCRKRKIKCSGPVGNQLGACSACASAGIDADCTFSRVGTMGDGEVRERLRGSQATTTVEMMPVTVYSMPSMANHNDASINAAYGLSSDTGGSSGMSYSVHQPSIPALSTRTNLSNEYNATYDTGTFESAYAYPTSTTAGRYDSSSSDGNPLYSNARPWSASGPSATPMALDSTYSFGNIQAQFPYHRLPSATQDSFSSLDMELLNASLPPQTMQTRRLPALPTTYAQPHPQPGTSHIRPFGSFSTRTIPLNVAQSRNAMPWASDPQAAISRTGSNAWWPTSNSSGTVATANPNLSGLPNVEATYPYTIATSSTTESNHPEDSPVSNLQTTGNTSPTSSTGPMMLSATNQRAPPTWPNTSAFPYTGQSALAHESNLRYGTYVNYAEQRWKECTAEESAHTVPTEHGAAAYESSIYADHRQPPQQQQQQQRQQQQQKSHRHTSTKTESHSYRGSSTSSEDRRLSNAQRLSISNLR